MGFNSLTLRVFNRVRFLALTDLSTAALNIVLAVVLIQQFGAVGAADRHVGHVHPAERHLPMGSQDPDLGPRARSSLRPAVRLDHHRLHRRRRGRAAHQTAVPDRHLRRRRRVAPGVRDQSPFAPDRRYVPGTRPLSDDAPHLRRPVDHMTEQPPRRSRVPPPFPPLAYLYQPADPNVGDRDRRGRRPMGPARLCAR